MKKFYTLLLLLFPFVAPAQPDRRLVADQTFRMDGDHEFTYALAQGDVIDLYVGELSRKKLKSVELLQFPNTMIFQSYQPDTALHQTFTINQTGIYLLRFSESGLAKKVCRFTLHRTPSTPEMARMDTRVTWDLRQYAEFLVRRRSIETGKRTEVVSLGGQATVAASKFGINSPRATYQFTLPPNTVRWAYRLAVGQAAAEAQRKDADNFRNLVTKGSVKIMGIQPQTALAAYALGLAVNMTVSTSGEDVEYAILDGQNVQLFLKGDEYQAFMQQSSVAVDVQRRYTPLEGTYYFALKSDNWVQNIDVFIDIEAVTETPVYETETFLEPVRN